MTQKTPDRSMPLLGGRTISVTQFKRHPLRTVEEVVQARVSRLAVLAYNKPAFYVITPDEMGRLLAADKALADLRRKESTQ